MRPLFQAPRAFREHPGTEGLSSTLGQREVLFVPAGYLDGLVSPALQHAEVLRLLYG